MPLYEYQCVDCGGRDQRVAGLDDHTALCAHCGGLMLRLDADIFLPFFEEQERVNQILARSAARLALAREQLDACARFTRRPADLTRPGPCCGRSDTADLCRACARSSQEVLP